MEEYRDLINNLMNPDVSKENALKNFVASVDGKTEKEKESLAKAIVRKLLFPKLRKASVKGLIVIDFMRYFNDNAIEGVDMIDMISDLVSAGYESGLKECHECKNEDGDMNVDEVMPKVKRIYSEITDKYPEINSANEKIKLQLKAAIVFSMRAAVQDITKEEYLDLMIGKNL